MEKHLSLQDIRKNYSLKELTKQAVLDHPLAQFQVWMQEALTSGIDEATAMTLSTSDQQGRPSARVVLLKEVDTHGFVFYTNYLSRKGQQLAQNPYAALTFFWPALERQVRVEGRVEKVSPKVSEAYFQSRPTGSQVGAWASPQSQPIANRNVLVQLEQEAARKFEGLAVLPKPEHWGGYRVVPDRVEFWQGRPSRLHDRLVYECTPEGHWHLQRLAP